MHMSHLCPTRRVATKRRCARLAPTRKRSSISRRHEDGMAAGRGSTVRAVMKSHIHRRSSRPASRQLRQTAPARVRHRGSLRLERMHVSSSRLRSAIFKGVCSRLMGPR
jgi:hypothetical protein